MKFAVTVWAVYVVEAHPPTGGEPLEWLLLTTEAVPTVETAVERVEWYGVRFGIEVWHKVLKSGCRIETRQLERAERLQRWIEVGIGVAPLVVELDHVLQRLQAAVVHVRRGQRHVAQRRRAERTAVVLILRDEVPSDVFLARALARDVGNAQGRVAPAKLQYVKIVAANSPRRLA